jgi:hypothetical protein
MWFARIVRLQCNRSLRCSRAHDGCQGVGRFNSRAERSSPIGNAIIDLHQCSLGDRSLAFLRP